MRPVSWLIVLLAAGCTGEPEPTLTVSGSALGAEGEVLTRQIDRFAAREPGVRIEIAPPGCRSSWISRARDRFWR